MATKQHARDGHGSRKGRHNVNIVASSPELQNENPNQDEMDKNLPQDGRWFSDTKLKSPQNREVSENPDQLEQENNQQKDSDETLKDIFQAGERNFFKSSVMCFFEENFKQFKDYKENKSTKPKHTSAKHKSFRPGASGEDDSVSRQIREIQTDARRSARIIRDSKSRLLEMVKKEQLTAIEIRELAERNELLLREMERFDRLTKTVQRLVETEMEKIKEMQKENERYLEKQNQEIVVVHPSTSLSDRTDDFEIEPATTRGKSDVDLTRKLFESYDMQEKLVADNAELEMKRYTLYKELMTKDQCLETCRAQVKRLQGELKLVANENAMLQEKLYKNHPEGDAASVKRDSSCQPDTDTSLEFSGQNSYEYKELQNKIREYKEHIANLENRLRELSEVAEGSSENFNMSSKDKRDDDKPKEHTCKGTGCYDKKDGLPIPPMSKACGKCPPCPAPCNPDAPPTPAEKEVARLTNQLKNTEENFKVKIAECAMLRCELMKKKEELEKERCQHRDTQRKLRELEMRFEGLATTTNMNLGTKEQAFENEINVRALKKCYREARDEIDELRTLIKELNEQCQEYRVKYLQAQQLVEEQKRQLDVMDCDNARISEQINCEIQKVKLKFQEKLQELAAIPDLLKATQCRLKDSQQAQALAEHKAEQLARELNCCREKVHMLLYQSTKQCTEKPTNEKSNEEKQIMLLQQRVTQLTEINQSLKTEIERLKSNVIKLEEAVLCNERRLCEKMHECAQLGGELDRCREESARALSRAQERLDSTRKCLQTTIAELEKQLALSRAQVRTSEKEREELQQRMQCQILRLNDNLEQGQLRIMSLQNQMKILRKSKEDEGGDSDLEMEKMQCACKTAFS